VRVRNQKFGWAGAWFDLSGSFEKGYVAFNRDDKMEKAAVEQAQWLTKFHGTRIPLSSA